jgi:hypothetical protein
MTVTRSHLLGIALCVALGFALFAMFESDDAVQVSSQPVTTSTTSTTTPTSTTIVIVDGVPFAIPIPPLPPGITLGDGPGSVTNVHRRVGSIEEILATAPPEQREAIAKAWDDMLRQMGAGQVPTTTTTTR